MDGTLENCPGMKERVARLIALLRSAMYPHIFGTSSRRGSAASAIAVSYNLQSAAELLEQILTTLQPERTPRKRPTRSFSAFLSRSRRSKRASRLTFRPLTTATPPR